MTFLFNDNQVLHCYSKLPRLRSEMYFRGRYCWLGSVVPGTVRLQYQQHAVILAKISMESLFSVRTTGILRISLEQFVFPWSSLTKWAQKHAVLRAYGSNHPATPPFSPHLADIPALASLASDQRRMLFGGHQQRPPVWGGPQPVRQGRDTPGAGRRAKGRQEGRRRGDYGGSMGILRRYVGAIKSCAITPLYGPVLLGVVSLAEIRQGRGASLVRDMFLQARKSLENGVATRLNGLVAVRRIGFAAAGVRTVRMSTPPRSRVGPSLPRAHQQ